MDQFEHVGSEFIARLLDPAMRPEHAIAGLFRLRCAGGPRPVDERMPFFNPDTDMVVCAFSPGQAGIAIYHADASATAIEIRDGTRGYMHVLEGIRRSLAYTTELALKGGASHVRGALMWTSVGNATVDAVIEIGCERAGVIPLPWGALKTHLAALDPTGERLCPRPNPLS